MPCYYFFWYSGVLASGGAPNHMTAGLMATVMERGDLTKLVHETRLENQVRVWENGWMNGVMDG